MKRILLKLLIVMSFAGHLAQAANDIHPDQEFYTAVPRTGPITIDGNLSDWGGVPVLADPRFSVCAGKEGSAAAEGCGTNGVYVLFERYQGGDWTGPDDHTSAVQVAWDEENVYFGFTVTDEYHENSANSAWNGDSVQLMIADETRTQQVALYNYALGGIETRLGNLVTADRYEAGPAASTDCACPTEVAIKRDTTAKKTYYEIRLPKASLGLETLQSGTQFGLGMSINDGDRTSPGQKGWGGLGVHSIVYNGKNPEHTALVTLGSTQTAVEILGTGSAALLKGDLTDPEDDGKDEAGAATDPSWNWAAITASQKADFDGEGAFNVFDNKVGGSTNKWCCDDPTVDAPVWVAVEFKNPVSLTHFTVTSGNDSPDRDPVNWAIQGSTNGTAYTDIYHYNSTPSLWTARDQVLKFTLPAPTSLYKFVRYIAYQTPGDLHQLNEIEYFGTIGGADRFFLSAINPTAARLTLRATDVADSKVDPASAKVWIDEQAVSVTSTNIDSATDFTATYPARLAPGSTHNYKIEVKDTLGNIVTAAAEFTLPTGIFPTTNLPGPAAPNKAWATRFVFGTGAQFTDVVTALAALQAVGSAEFSGSVVDATNEVINFNTGGFFANPVAYPDAVTSDGNWLGDDFVMLAVGHVQIDEEGDYTFGVHSDDGFGLRIRGASVVSVSGGAQTDLADPETVVYPGTTGDSNTRVVYHLRRGVYRIEFVWFERSAGEHAELFAAKGAFQNDGDTSTWRLLGDNAASQTFNALGVDNAGWTVISSDPNSPDQLLTDWATANAALEATGGSPTNYDRLEVGDPETNPGFLAFPKNTAIDDNDFALKATANLVVPATGTYVLGFNSDDGAYMKVTGQNFTEIVQNLTGSSVLDADTVTCDCQTGDSGTTATIDLAQGTYPIEVGMFDRSGGAYIRARGAQLGAPQLPILAKNGAVPFTTGQPILLTDAAPGISGGGDTAITATRTGNVLTIQWTPSGGTLESTTSLSGAPAWSPLGTANPASITIGNERAVFYRVKK